MITVTIVVSMYRLSAPPAFNMFLSSRIRTFDWCRSLFADDLNAFKLGYYQRWSSVAVACCGIGYISDSLSIQQIITLTGNHRESVKVPAQVRGLSPFLSFHPRTWQLPDETTVIKCLQLNYLHSHKWQLWFCSDWSESLSRSCWMSSLTSPMEIRSPVAFE